MKRGVWAAGHPSGQEADISAPRRGTTPWHLVTETGNGDYTEMCRQQRRMCFLGKLGEMKMIPEINIKHSVSGWEASKKNESMKTQRTGSSMAIREWGLSEPACQKKTILTTMLYEKGKEAMVFKTDRGHDPVLSSKKREYFREAPEARWSYSPFPPQLRVSASFSEHVWWSQGILYSNYRILSCSGGTDQIPFLFKCHNVEFSR